MVLVEAGSGNEKIRLGQLRREGGSGRERHNKVLVEGRCLPNKHARRMLLPTGVSSISTVEVSQLSRIPL
jgi:hypothetical protein